MRHILIIFALCFSLKGYTQNLSSTAVIYADQVITTDYIGNGVQWSAYPHADSPEAEWGDLMTAKKWNMIFDRLDFMRPKLIRVMDQANWRYLKGFDGKGEPILDFNSPEVKTLQKLLDYCQKNKITVLFGEWGCPSQIKGSDSSGHFKGANDPGWINMIVKYLDFLINTKGYTCLKYYNLVNEPNGYWASTEGNWEEWSEGVKMLHKALTENGLAAKIQIAGPDVVAEYDNPVSKYTGIEWVAESTRQLDDQLGIYEIHAYTNYDLVQSGNFAKLYSGIAQLAKRMKKPIIFGEIGFDKMTEENQKRVKTDRYASEDSQMSVYDFSYGVDMADVAIQIMNSGYSGAAAWDLDDAMHTLGDQGDKSKLKRWGFWNSLGTEICNNPSDENIRPWFYSWSLLCRYFPNGINIVKSDSIAIEGVRMVAGVKEGAITIALVNNGSLNQKLQLKLDGSLILKSFKKFIYSNTIRPVDGKWFPVPQETGFLNLSGGEMQVEIPAKSLIMYTTFNF
jgi:hypothetical protein